MIFFVFSYVQVKHEVIFYDITFCILPWCIAQHRMITELIYWDKLG